MSTEPLACPSCAAPAAGNFCSSCGASLAGAVCAGCATPLTPGARFCHRCGTPAGERPPAGAREGAPPSPIGRDERAFAALPWAVSAIALVALIALIAGQRFSGARQTATADPSAGASTLPGLDRGAAAIRAPDISQMTPAERATRLYDRVMGLAERGRRDSVALFAPMAMNAYLMLDSLGADERYDLGRIALVAGDAAVARAQADTILAAHPAHLLGLLLAADAATLRGDTAAARTHLQRFTAAVPAERARGLPEYERHAAEIDARRNPAPR